jgi:hypothetical protein
MENEKVVVLQIKLTRNRCLLLLALAFLCYHPHLAGSETLTLTTYYPAPYGGYVSLLTTDKTILARDNGSVALGAGGAGALTMTGNGQPVKLDMRGGGIEMDGGLTIHSRGRMHIAGEELLYLLNKNGVIVGQEWGGNGNLTVEGSEIIGSDLTVGGTINGLCVKQAYTKTGNQSCPTAGQIVVAHWGDNLPTNQIIGFLPRGPGDIVNGTFIGLGEDYGGTMLCCKFNAP